MTIEPSAFRSELIRVFSENGLGSCLTDERADALTAFAVRLVETNEKFNLTAVKTPDEIILKHFADSAALVSRLPKTGTVLDVGCGAGFPSVVLAILCPALALTALDATEKKVRFVSDTAASLGLSNLTAITGRAEALAAPGSPYRESFSVVTARAVAALPTLAELCLPFVSVGGVFLAMKGQGAKSEAEAASHAIPMLGGKLREIGTDVLSDGGEPIRHAVLTIDKIRKTPPEYPRAYARILKKPL